MFCKQCGKRIEADTRQCPYCGRPADVLSGGTGFWNLTQTPPPAAQVPVQQPVPQQPAPAAIPVVRSAVPVSPVVEAPPPMPETPAEPEKKSGGRLLMVIFIGIMAMMLITIVILGAKVGKLSDKLEAAQETLAAMETIQEEAEPEAPEAPEQVEPPVVEASAEEEPVETPEPSSKPTPEPTPEPSEEPEEAPEESPEPVAEAIVPEEPAVLTAELSRNWDSITLEVDDGGLEVESYQWIVVYDPALETTEDVLKVLDQAAAEEDETIRTTLISQADPYDGSSNLPQQKIPVAEFYQTTDNCTKRMFCKMTLQDGQVYCSDMILPILAATDGYVSFLTMGDSVTAAVNVLPSIMTGDEIACCWIESDPATGTETVLNGMPYEAGLQMEITMAADKRYYFAMEKGGVRIILNEALVLETQNRSL